MLRFLLFSGLVLAAGGAVAGFQPQLLARAPALAAVIERLLPAAHRPAAAPDTSTKPKASTRATGRHQLAGEASWYGPGFQGRPTASGEPFDMGQLTAAHKTLPFGTRVKVEALDTGRSVVVRINDRGPFVPGRIIDVSRAAGARLGLLDAGHGRVRLTIL